MIRFASKALAIAAIAAVPAQAQSVKAGGAAAGSNAFHTRPGIVDRDADGSYALFGGALFAVDSTGLRMSGIATDGKGVRVTYGDVYKPPFCSVDVTVWPGKWLDPAMMQESMAFRNNPSGYVLYGTDVQSVGDADPKFRNVMIGRIYKKPASIHQSNLRMMQIGDIVFKIVKECDYRPGDDPAILSRVGTKLLAPR